jgi:hypothetical protein
MKILIIRTIKSELIPHFINKLEKNFKMPKLYILTHKNQHSLNFFKSKFVKVFFHKTNNDFCKVNLNKNLLKDLQKIKFDLIVMPRLFDTKKGFLDVLGMSFSIKAKKIAILPYKSNFIYINKFFLVKYYLIKFFGTILSTILQIIFWPIFLVSLLIKFLFRFNN